jgi:uncharacterized protein
LKFWDTSAVIPLLVDEPASATLKSLLREDREMVVWWTTRVESISALVCRSREGLAGAEGEERPRTVLKDLAHGWLEAQPTVRLRSLAERILAVHPLRVADALQLAAAALRWCEGESEGRGFVCLDGRLREAARKEGFSLLPRLE